MKPTLLVLAAGMGSRYGGLKQIDPVGPSGETLLDYSVFDAIRAGFGRVVFVIRRDFEALFRGKIGAKYSGRAQVDYAFQSPDDLPPGFAASPERVKPWGTGHAAWCAREIVREPFAVINADDFYGADAFRRLADFLRGARDDEAALVGFTLSRTLSESGAVSRGVCDVAPGGLLRGITEHTRIVPADVGPGKKFSGNETVSMNCWGFAPRIFEGLGSGFSEFLKISAALPSAEFYLPAAVSAMVAHGTLTVRALTADADWFGITHREDKPRVAAAIAALVKAGAYPAKLF
ncbi:NTP transferase domain-containing protein [Termitidicoccus mucosus]|uniref:Nucleotidyltransferase n=1 Tax=Termitidicoccus mucosus TaxID=1184151 RepID=A0A178IHR0_9BACT|nr:nucleotidyltransferase [Opitutaceae bacterium TSB47]